MESVFWGPYRQVLLAEQAGISAAWSKGVMGCLTAIVMYSTYALGLWYGAKLISDGIDEDPECKPLRSRIGTKPPFD